MDPSGAAPPDAVLPRWPLYMRFADHDEVKVADLYGDTAPEMVQAIADALREMADYLDGRVSNM